MLEAIRNTNPNSDYMYVVDTRPRINAMANRAAGKGYENEAIYKNIKFQFLGIENIHVMRTSLQKLVESKWHTRWHKFEIFVYFDFVNECSLWAEITYNEWIFRFIGIVWLAEAYTRNIGHIAVSVSPKFPFPLHNRHVNSMQIPVS